MKKQFITGFVAGAVAFGTIGALAAGLMANPNPFPVQLNGKDVSIEGYNIEGSTYFKLRDVADAVGGFTVDFKDNIIKLSNRQTTSNSAIENDYVLKGYISYEGYDWCPDFGKYLGIKCELDFDSESGGHVWIYNADNITTEMIYKYANLLTNNGFAMVEIDSGIGVTNSDRTKNLGVVYTSDEKSIMVMVW